MVNQNWVFGVGAELDFSSVPPIARNNGRLIDTNEGCSSISDANGNLLFYTDGLKVWDNTNQVRVTGLRGNKSSTQSSIIVPVPAMSDEYYILTADGASGTDHHIAATQININTWNAQSILLQGAFDVTSTSPTEKITAIQKDNCSDFWLLTVVQEKTAITGGVGRGILRIFEITSSGIQHYSDTSLDETVRDLGYLKASSDSKKIAFANWVAHTIILLDFDVVTGSINLITKQVISITTVPISLTNPQPNSQHSRCVYGIEFSPDNQFLYFTVISNASYVTGNKGRGYVYQLEIATSSLLLIDTYENNGTYYALGALQRGQDDKIYIAQSATRFLGVIENPNGTTRANIDLKWDEIELPQGLECRMGLPNLLPNPCEDDHDCGCGCAGCNENAETLNQELIDRAKKKHNHLSDGSIPPFKANCTISAVKKSVNLEPDFHFHWGDSAQDQIEEHDTEVFYLTVCNNYNDIQFNGLQVTKLTLVPDVADLDKIHIVPDRFVHFDCLTACSCQTREFALITRGTDIAGNYELMIEYCFDNISISTGQNSGEVTFPVEIVKD